MQKNNSFQVQNSCSLNIARLSIANQNSTILFICAYDELIDYVLCTFLRNMSILRGEFNPTRRQTSFRPSLDKFHNKLNTTYADK